MYKTGFLSPLVIFHRPFQSGTSVLVPQRYMFYVCGYMYMVSSDMVICITAVRYASCVVLFCNVK